MDELIRKLQRWAQQGGPDEQAQAERALDRLGVDALRYREPKPLPDKPHRVPRDASKAEAKGSELRAKLKWYPSSSGTAKTRAEMKRAARRHDRRAGKALTRDWEEW